jgi:hypothetical protein
MGEQEQLFTELLRVLARSYYDTYNTEAKDDDNGVDEKKQKLWPKGAAVLIMDAFIEKDRKTDHNVKEGELADELHMSHKLVLLIHQSLSSIIIITIISHW